MRYFWLIYGSCVPTDISLADSSSRLVMRQEVTWNNYELSNTHKYIYYTTIPISLMGPRLWMKKSHFTCTGGPVHKKRS